MRHILGFLIFFAGALIRILGSVAAAMLPRRYWAGLQRHVPVYEASAFAGITTFLTAGVIGGRGYLTYLEEQARLFNDLAMNSPGYAAAGTGPLFLLLSLFTFMFFTPVGLLSGYLGLTGFLRFISGWIDDGFGDPVLTVIDSGVRTCVLRAQARSVQRKRLAAEGPELPDRAVRPSSVGMNGPDLVIVASRSKPDWDAGTVVVTQLGPYRVGHVEERIIGGKLRTLYPLKAHTDQEVFRRSVNYELPVTPSLSADAN